MSKWLKPLLFAIWGLLLIPLVGTALEKWLAENAIGEFSALAAAVSDHLAAIGTRPWYRFALVFMTGLVVGVLLEASRQRSGERRAFELRSLGYRFRSLSDALKSRTAPPPWPDNARDLRPAITSVLGTARTFQLWAPGERVYDLPDASFLCQYFDSVGKLLEDGQPEEARSEALSWRPFLDRGMAGPA